MRLSEFFYFLKTGRQDGFTHLDLTPAAQRYRKQILKVIAEEKKRSAKNNKEIDLFEDL